LEMRKTRYGSIINFKVPAKIRSAIEEYATDRDITLSEATRYFLEVGIKSTKMEAVS
jgi:hypothetical protein